MTLLVTSLLWFSALGCGLLAGLYFAFSTRKRSDLAGGSTGLGTVLT